MLGTVDGYCNGKPSEDEPCSNQNCYACNNQAVIPLSETNRLIFNIYTPDNAKNGDRTFNESDKLAFEKTIDTDSVSADIYSPLYDDNGMHTEVEIDETKIFFRASEKQSLEEFETDLARLEFVKIGDLLNETREETTSAENASETLSEEEISTVADNAITPEESTAT